MRKLTLSLIVSLFFAATAFSQVTNDAGLWCTFSIEKKINKKFSYFFVEEFRQRENFTRINLFYTQPGITYKPFDFLKVSLAYRLIQKYEPDNTFSYRHRLMLDITAKKKFGKLGVSFRERIQAENRNIYSSAKGRYPEWFSRNKFKFEYDIDKPITPYVGVEFRYQFVNPRATESDMQWSRNRYFFGLDYKRNDRHSFGIYYLIQQEYAISSPQDLYIIGIEYGISL